jgi:uncharacterized protein involved in outer membrane biogenesis
MKKKSTLPLILLAALAMGYLLATIVLNQFLSEERLRLMLIEPVEDQLGRQLEIGAIDVSFFSGINITDIMVHGQEPAEDFLSIAAFRLDFQLLPLLRKKLVLTEIVIDQPSLKLSRNAKGVYNFADLSLKPKKIEKEIPPPEEQTVEPLPLTLIFERIAVNHASLTFTDQTGELPGIIDSQGDLTMRLTLGRNLAESSFQGSLDLIANADYHGHKPVLIMTCSFNEQQIGFKGDLSLDFEKLFFNGQLTGLPGNPDLILDLRSNSLDLARLAELKAATGKKPPAPVVTTVAEQPTGEPGQTAPPAAAGKFGAHGQISVGNLQHGKTTIRNLNLAYGFKDKRLALDDLNFVLFEGTVNGRLLADFNGPAPDFQGEIATANLLIAELMVSLGKPAAYLSGALSADLAFEGAGRDWPEIRNRLNGDGRFSLVKGGVAGSPYSQALASLLDIPELNELGFDELAGTLKITDGRISLLSTMSSPEFDLQTKGSAGLDGTLDLPLTIQLSPENSQRLLTKSKYTGYLADQSGRTTLNLKLTGTVNQPQLALDSSSTGEQAKKILEKKAREELGRAINKQLGGDEATRKSTEELSERFLKQLLGN